MNLRVLLLSSLIMGLLSGCASLGGDARAAAQLEQMAWLVGGWQRSDLPDGRSGHETWRLAEDGYVGSAATKHGDKVVFEERMRITIREGQIVYIVTAGDAEPVVFTLTELDETGFVVENPAHDYPQRIAYRHEGENMSAHISATEPSRTRIFHFRRAAFHQARPNTLPSGR